MYGLSSVSYLVDPHPVPISFAYEERVSTQTLYLSPGRLFLVEGGAHRMDAVEPPRQDLGIQILVNVALLLLSCMGVSFSLCLLVVSRAVSHMASVDRSSTSGRYILYLSVRVPQSLTLTCTAVRVFVSGTRTPPLGAQQLSCLSLVVLVSSSLL